MTSNMCYVYITLPGQTVSVTAGRYELTTDARWGRRSLRLWT
jgi:hypothetical protein